MYQELLATFDSNQVDFALPFIVTKSTIYKVALGPHINCISTT